MRGVLALAKSLTFAVSRHLGINRAARRLMRHRVRILCYHGVVAEPQSDRFRYGNTVSIGEFDRQLKALRRHFTPISLGDLMAWLEGGAALPNDAVLLTFDDGY